MWTKCLAKTCLAMFDKGHSLLNGNKLYKTLNTCTWKYGTYEYILKFRYQNLNGYYKICIIKLLIIKVGWAWLVNHSVYNWVPSLSEDCCSFWIQNMSLVKVSRTLGSTIYRIIFVWPLSLMGRLWRAIICV